MPGETNESTEHRSFVEMTKDRCSIYAKEISETFRKERTLRMSLQERDSMLHQRARAGSPH
jgi:hypothetical protein